MASALEASAAALPAPDEADRDSFDHSPCYCEENVWRLCRRLAARIAGGGSPHAAAQRLHAVFISNSARQVPLWRQRAGGGADGLVCWDYHVLLLELRGRAAWVWDLDSTLPFPCPLQRYRDQALLPAEMAARLPPRMRRRFRVVAAAQFLQNFASDRRHMLRADGSYSATPPAHACIVSQSGEAHTLAEYLATDSPALRVPAALELQQAPFGVVLEESDFLRCFGAD